MTDRSTWKKAERRNAKFIGASRNPYSGGMSKISSSDSTSGTFYLETKYKKRWHIFSLFRKLLSPANKEGKLPILALKEKGSKLDLWVVRREDLPKIAAFFKEKKVGT